MLKPSYKNYSSTTVRAETTQAELSRELSRYGIYKVQHTSTENVFSLAFQVEVEDAPKPITVRIDVPYDREKDSEDKYGWKLQRIKYRALFYYVKSLLIAWDDGVKTFTEIFMPFIVLPGGRTVSQDLLPKYKMAIERGEIGNVPLLQGGDDGSQ